MTHMRSSVNFMDSNDTAWRTLAHAITSVPNDQMYATAFSEEGAAQRLLRKRKRAAAGLPVEEEPLPKLIKSLTNPDGHLFSARLDLANMIKQERHPINAVLRCTDATQRSVRIRCIRGAILRSSADLRDRHVLPWSQDPWP